MALYQTKGIILKITPWGEVSQLFSIYTQALGKVVAIGQGTKKITSKLNGHLQPLGIVDLLIASGKNFDKLAGAVLIKNFSNLKKNFRNIILANFSLELLDQLTEQKQPDDRIFDLLERYLTWLDKNNDITKKSWAVAKNHFISELLRLLGYQPPAAVAQSSSQLDKMLKNHLNQELQVENFLKKLVLD